MTTTTTRIVDRVIGLSGKLQQGFIESQVALAKYQVSDCFKLPSQFTHDKVEESMKSWRKQIYSEIKNEYRNLFSYYYAVNAVTEYLESEGFVVETGTVKGDDSVVFFITLPAGVV